MEDVLLAIMADFFSIRSADASTDFLTLAFSTIAYTTKSTSFFYNAYISRAKVIFFFDFTASYYVSFFLLTSLSNQLLTNYYDFFNEMSFES